VNDVSAGLAGTAVRTSSLPVEPWPTRFGRTVMSYLPLVVMALLALVTWWLVENSPLSEGPGVVPPPRHEPDYTMRHFTVLRYARDGSLRTEIEGDVALHFPDTDTLEIENPRIRAVAPDGSVTRASARRALANGDGTEVQLLGGARVTQEATPTESAIDFWGEFLHVFVNTERVRSHLPVRVKQGATEVQAAGMDYDNLARVIDLKGRMRGIFVPPAREGRNDRKAPTP
jgi:lipopolysaccharide export system protein LptC